MLIDRLRKNLDILLLLVFFIPIAYLNTNIYWMLVDDGYSVVFSRELFGKLARLELVAIFDQLVEDSGRFRPVYWFYQMFVWLLGGNDYRVWHLVHMFVIGATVIFVYLTIKKLTRSRPISVIAALFYLLTPLNTENILRLGPQEPILVMFLSALFYFLVNQNNSLFFLSFLAFLSVFTKENSIAIFPSLLIFYFFLRKGYIANRKYVSLFLHLLLTVFVGSIVLLTITFLNRSGYSTNYYFDMNLIFGNLIVYIKDLAKGSLYIFFLAMASYLLRNVSLLIRGKSIFKTDISVYQFIFFLAFWSFFLIQLPWKYALTRYLMPTVFFAVLFSFLEIFIFLFSARKIIFLSKGGEVLRLVTSFLFFYIFSIWFIQIIFKESSVVSYEKAFEYMANLPQQTFLLVNMPEHEGTIELVYEIDLQLSEFWDRPDLEVRYLDFENLPDGNFVIVDSDGLPRRYNQEEFFNYKIQNSIRNDSKGLVITTPLELIKQSIKKLFRYIFYKEKMTSEGLWAFYYNRNNWYFYSRE